MNMAYIFKYLIALGKEYNATVHIPGGVNGADLHLEPRHSPKVSQSWEHYFDVTANDGNPFHDLYEGEDCKEIWDVDTDFLKLFQDGETCLTFRARFDHYTKKPAKELIKKYKPDMPYSRDVVNSAKLVKGKLPENYGVIHVRRCDRLNTNANCTAVDNILASVKTMQQDPKKHVDAWVVFSYAESGYDELLQGRLTELGIKSIFEKDLSFALQPNNEEDNYFAYWVTDSVMGGASVLLNTHNCKTGTFARIHPPEKHVEYSKIMSEDMMQSKGLCTWKPGDPAKPMYRNQ